MTAGGEEKEERRRYHSSQCFTYYISLDIGQPEVPSLELERESLMIDPEKVENRRLKIVHVNRV